MHSAPIFLYLILASLPTFAAAEPQCDASKVRPTIAGRGDLDQFKLLLCDGFSESALNTRLWSYNFTWGDTRQIVGDGRIFNFNSVLDESQVSTSEGMLHLRAINEPSPLATIRHADGTTELRRMPDNFCAALKGNNYSQCELRYTSGAVTSRFKFKYGYLEGRFRLPDTMGFWPAFWLLHEGWPPEIDIFELLTNMAPDGTYRYLLSQSYHYKQGADNQSRYLDLNYNYLQQLGLCDQPRVGCGQKLGTMFHTFGIEWTPQYLRYYIDGIQTLSFDYGDAITNVRAYVLINLGVGGWADNPDASTDWSKAQVEVDWIRYWQLPDGLGQAFLPE